MALSKEIQIGDISISMKASADTPRVYRHIFGRDLFEDFNNLNLDMTKGSLDTGNTEVIENIAYVMARQADPDIMPIDEWLDQFGMFDIYFSASEILALWGTNMKGRSKPKKK